VNGRSVVIKSEWDARTPRCSCAGSPKEGHSVSKTAVVVLALLILGMKLMLPNSKDIYKAYLTGCTFDQAQDPWILADCERMAEKYARNRPILSFSDRFSLK
jgi:hypothetical protein